MGNIGFSRTTKGTPSVVGRLSVEGGRFAGWVRSKKGSSERTNSFASLARRTAVRRWEGGRGGGGVASSTRSIWSGRKGSARLRVPPRPLAKRPRGGALRFYSLTADAARGWEDPPLRDCLRYAHSRRCTYETVEGARANQAPEPGPAADPFRKGRLCAGYSNAGVRPEALPIVGPVVPDVPLGKVGQD